MVVDNFKKHLQALKDLRDGTWQKPENGAKLLQGYDHKKRASEEIDVIFESLKNGRHPEHAAAFNEVFGKAKEEKADKKANK